MATADPYEPRLVETVRDRGRERRENGSTTPDKVLQTLDQDMVVFRRCIQSIGTQLDSGSNRKEIKRLRSVIKKKIADSEKKLKKDKKNGRSGGAEKIQFERQSKQLDSQLHTFQDLLQEEMRATKQHPKPPVAVSPPPSSRGGVDSTNYGGDHLGHIQTQGQLSSNRLEEAEMQAEELVELERDINDLHMIQRDLAELVGEQGEVVVRIDQQVARTQIRVERGQKQLKEAERLKRKNRCFLCRHLFCCCCCC